MAMSQNVEYIARILKCRDGVSMREAQIMINDCLIELESAIQSGASYDECTDIIASYLSLEPDYLDAVLNELC